MGSGGFGGCGHSNMVVIVGWQWQCSEGDGGGCDGGSSGSSCCRINENDVLHFQFSSVL